MVHSWIASEGLTLAETKHASCKDFATNIIGAGQRWAVVTTAAGNSHILANRLEFESHGVEGFGHAPGGGAARR